MLEKKTQDIKFRPNGTFYVKKEDFLAREDVKKQIKKFSKFEVNNE